MCANMSQTSPWAVGILMLWSCGAIAQEAEKRDVQEQNLQKQNVQKQSVQKRGVQKQGVQQRGARDQEALEKAFSDRLENAIFQGTWQVTDEEGLRGQGKLSDPKTDRYTIVSAKKMLNDRWLIMARIQYGEKDATVPIPIRVVWAGDTPVITLDELTIPFMGTYSARVMVHRNFYAGTWFGDCYGGIMSGQIVKAGVQGDARVGNVAGDRVVPEVVISANPKTGEVVFVEISENAVDFTKGAMSGEDGKSTKTSYLSVVRREVPIWKRGKGGTLVLSFDRMMGDAETFMGPVAFDTDTEDWHGSRNGLGSIFGPMLGKSILLKADGGGRILSASGMEDIFFEVQDHASSMFLFAQMESELTDDAVKYRWGDSIWAFYPDEGVRIGDTWTRTVRRNDVYLGQLEYRYRCSLDGVGLENERRMARIGYEAEIRLLDGAGRARRFNTLVTFQEGHIEGYAMYDLERGEIVNMSETERSTAIGESDGTQPGEVVPVEFKRTVERTMRILTADERRAQREPVKTDE